MTFCFSLCLSELVGNYQRILQKLS